MEKRLLRIRMSRVLVLILVRLSAAQANRAAGHQVVLEKVVGHGSVVAVHVDCRGATVQLTDECVVDNGEVLTAVGRERGAMSIRPGQGTVDEGVGQDEVARNADTARPMLWTRKWSATNEPSHF